MEKQFGWLELDEANDVWTSSGVGVRVVKEELCVIYGRFSDKPRGSERKNKPCVCV